MNYFPTNYQQFYPQPQTNALTWVCGEEAARSWYVQPNSTVALWDSESQTIYLKSADASGMPTMKILDYTLRSPQKPAERIEEAMVDMLPVRISTRYMSKLATLERKSILSPSDAPRRKRR